MADIPEILRKAVKATIRVREIDSDVLHVVIAQTSEMAEEMVRAIGEKAIRAGRAVTWEDGTKEWINVEAEWVDGDYVWAEDGDLVRCTRTHIRVSSTGGRTVTQLRRVWRFFDDVAG
jgi:hypothetical protein